jgi:hypothetical protein
MEARPIEEPRAMGRAGDTRGRIIFFYRHLMRMTEENSSLDYCS